MDRTALSYWFPKLVAAGVPVPVTTLVQAQSDELRDIYRVFDGEEMTGTAQPFFDAIKAAADDIVVSRAGGGAVAPKIVDAVVLLIPVFHASLGVDHGDDRGLRGRTSDQDQSDTGEQS